MTPYTPHILLTGATGFIGRHLLPLLSDCRVDTLGRSPSSTIPCDLETTVPTLPSSSSSPSLPPSNSSPCPSDSPCTAVFRGEAPEGSAAPSSPRTQSAVFRGEAPEESAAPRYDAVIHLAGTADPLHADPLNNHGTKRLLQALEPCPPRHFTLVSSVHVYGNDPGEDVPEDCFLRPDTPYSRSKIRAEKACEEWCARHGVTLTILRPAPVVGPGMHGNLAHMAEGVRRGTYMHIRGNQALRSLVMVDDLVSVIRQTLGVPGVFNVTDGKPHTLKEIADSMARNFSANKRVLSCPDGLLRWTFRLFGWLPPVASLRAKYINLTTSATFSSAALQAALPSFDPYDTCAVMARTHPTYPYRQK